MKARTLQSASAIYPLYRARGWSWSPGDVQLSDVDPSSYLPIPPSLPADLYVPDIAPPEDRRYVCEGGGGGGGQLGVLIFAYVRRGLVDLGEHCGEVVGSWLEGGLRLERRRRSARLDVAWNFWVRRTDVPS